jgi:hypothetical protein
MQFFVKFYCLFTANHLLDSFRENYALKQSVIPNRPPPHTHYTNSERISSFKLT